MNNNEKAKIILRILNKTYPKVPIPLNYKNTFTLLISVLLSAQCTDVNVNNVTKDIYPKYNKPIHFVKLGRKYLNKKSFPYSNKINFNSIRKGEVIGEHEVRFSSGKEIIKLNHESFDRALYSEGALTAAIWLMSKKAGLYSMRDLLNFK